MPKRKSDNFGPILVDFAPGPDLQRTAIAPVDLAEQSAKALDAAMDTIQSMVQRISALPHTMPKEFSKVEVNFGIKLDVEAGALIAKTGGEASLNVTLTWERLKTR